MPWALLLSAVECTSQSPLTLKQIDCHQQWHAALAFPSHVRLFPELRSTSWGVLRVVPIYFHFHSRDGVWQTPRLPPSRASLPESPPSSICLLPLWLTPSISLWRNTNKTQKSDNLQVTPKDKRDPATLRNVAESLEEENRGVGRLGTFFKQKRAELNVNSLQREE